MADEQHDDDNVIPAPGPDETHPLPSDMREDGKDATGGNAPFSPADITPEGTELDDDHEQTSSSSKSSKKSQASSQGVSDAHESTEEHDTSGSSRN